MAFMNTLKSNYFFLSSMPIPLLENKYLPVAKYIDDHFGVEWKDLNIFTILDELVNLQTLFQLICHRMNMNTVRAC